MDHQKYQMFTSTQTARRELIVAELNEIEQTLSKLPEGTACVYNCNGRKRIAGHLNGKSHFYNQAELPLVKRLILRRYLEIRRDELYHLKDLLDATSEYEEKWMGESEQYLNEHPDHLDLLAEFFTKKSEPLKVWMNAPDAAAAPFQEERLIQVTSHLFVRSKSEALIVSALYKRSIPFRYEEPLAMGSKIYYPDFTIRDPKTGSTFIYEHFGMMDEPEYAEHAISKLLVYIQNGWIPSLNMIVTFETKDHPLDMLAIENALAVLR